MVRDDLSPVSSSDPFFNSRKIEWTHLMDELNNKKREPISSEPSQDLSIQLLFLVTISCGHLK